MRYAWILAAWGLWSSVAASELLAQPILDRVESAVRDQVGATDAAAAAAEAAPGEAGYLGVMADDRQTAPRGVMVTDVLAGGPAAQSGLLKGDLITAIDGVPVGTMSALSRAIQALPVGTKIAVVVNRVGTERQLDVVLGRRPESRLVGAGESGETTAKMAPTAPAGATDAPAPPRRPRLGIRTVDVTDEVRQRNHLPDLRGATVIAITRGAAADRAGLPLGAVILAVDDQPIDAPPDLATALDNAGAEVELTCVEGGQATRRRVTFDEAAAADPNLQQRGRPLGEPSDLGPIADRPEAADSQAAMISALEARIEELEKRVEALEAGR